MLPYSEINNVVTKWLLGWPDGERAQCNLGSAKYSHLKQVLTTKHPAFKIFIKAVDEPELVISRSRRGDLSIILSLLSSTLPQQKQNFPTTKLHWMKNHLMVIPLQFLFHLTQSYPSVSAVEEFSVFRLPLLLCSSASCPRAVCCLCPCLPSGDARCSEGRRGRGESPAKRPRGPLQTPNPGSSSTSGQPVPLSLLLGIAPATGSRGGKGRRRRRRGGSPPQCLV